MKRFELVEGTSAKFWEVGVEGKTLRTRWGRIGTDGQSKDKKFATPAEAESEMARAVREKTGKGYSEAGASVAKKPPVAAAAKPASKLDPETPQVPKTGDPTTSAFADFIRLLPPAATGDEALDQLLGAAESSKDASAATALAERANGVRALLARLEQIAASIGDVERAAAAERSVYEAVYVEQNARAARLAVLAQALATRLTPAIEAAMLRLFEEHPWSGVRLAVGDALVKASTTRTTFERLARAMDLEDPSMVWVRDIGTSAAVRIDPASSFDRLAARFEPELARASSYFVRGLFTALGLYAKPIDPRWFSFVVRFYDHREAVVLDAFLRGESVPAAVAAVAAFISQRASEGKPWIAYVGFTLVAWGPNGRGAAPAVVAAVTAALDAGWSDYRLTGPLNVLVAMDDPSVLPALRAIEGKAKRTAKTAFQEMLGKLARNEPDAPAAGKKGAAGAKKASSGKPADPERAVLAALLTDAGFSERRVAELVALARNRIVLEPGKKGGTGVGASRFGGEPDLPPGTPWPVARLPKKTAAEQLSQGLPGTPHTVDGSHVLVPLSFVAQLRLAELAPLDVDGKLPSAGLLSFFARQDVGLGDHGELFRIGACVLFHEDLGDLVPTAPPANVPKIDRYPARTIKMTRELPLPAPQLAYALGLVDDESARYDDAYGKAVRSSAFGALGHARAAYYRGLPSRGETLLLQLASGASTGFQWGDSSSIFFLIADAALAKRDFARAVCVADEC